MQCQRGWPGGKRVKKGSELVHEAALRQAWSQDGNGWHGLRGALPWGMKRSTYVHHGAAHRGQTSALGMKEPLKMGGVCVSTYARGKGEAVTALGALNLKQQQKVALLHMLCWDPQKPSCDAQPWASALLAGRVSFSSSSM